MNTPPWYSVPVGVEQSAHKLGVDATPVGTHREANVNLVRLLVAWLLERLGLVNWIDIAVTA